MTQSGAERSGTDPPGNRYAGKRKTCRRHNEPGQAHALTFSCFRRQALFNGARSCSWLIEALAAARERHAFDLWAYVIMPEHVHLLIFPREDSYSISNILLDIKRPVVRRALRYVREHSPDFLERMKDQQPNGSMRHRFWQRGGGYDRNLLHAAIIHNTNAYIHANPVRRGLVASPEDWTWSSAGYYADEREVPLRPDVENLPPLDLTRP